MRQLLIVILLFGLSSAFVTGSLPTPKHMKIDPHVELSDESRRPAILSYKFQITNFSGTFLIMSGIEELARLAESQRYELKMRVEVTQNVNLTLALDKCGLHSLPMRTVSYNEIIIFPPKFITILADVGLPRCTDINIPLRLLIKGDLNTTGAISFNMLDTSGTAKLMIENLLVNYLYPISYCVLAFIVLCAVTPMICSTIGKRCTRAEYIELTAMFKATE